MAIWTSIRRIKMMRETSRDAVKPWSSSWWYNFSLSLSLKQRVSRLTWADFSWSTLLASIAWDKYLLTRLDVAWYDAEWRFINGFRIFSSAENCIYTNDHPMIIILFICQSSIRMNHVNVSKKSRNEKNERKEKLRASLFLSDSENGREKKERMMFIRMWGRSKFPLWSPLWLRRILKDYLLTRVTWIRWWFRISKITNKFSLRQHGRCCHTDVREWNINGVLDWMEQWYHNRWYILKW